MKIVDDAAAAIRRTAARPPPSSCLAVVASNAASRKSVPAATSSVTAFAPRTSSVLPSTAHLAAIGDHAQPGDELHARLLCRHDRTARSSTSPSSAATVCRRLRPRQPHRERHAARLVARDPAHEHLVRKAGESFPHIMRIADAITHPRDRIVERQLTSIILGRLVAGKLERRDRRASCTSQTSHPRRAGKSACDS